MGENTTEESELWRKMEENRGWSRDSWVPNKSRKTREEVNEEVNQEVNRSESIGGYDSTGVPTCPVRVHQTSLMACVRRGHVRQRRRHLLLERRGHLGRRMVAVAAALLRAERKQPDADLHQL